VTNKDHYILYLQGDTVAGSKQGFEC